MTDTPVSPPETPARTGSRGPGVGQWIRWGAAFVVAVSAAVFVTCLTVDIGRFFSLRERAETYATHFIGRPLHIGRLSAFLTPGDFALDNVVIEGLTPDARPFLTARRITVHVPWWTLFEKRFVIEVGMTDWHMLIETWPGRTNLPHFKVPGAGKGGGAFTKTVNYVYADRGEFTYEDHATPWSVVARNLDVDLVHSSQNAYVGTASFRGGTVQIQGYKPMRADLTTRFTLDGPIVRLHRIDLVTDGSVSRVSGSVDFAHFPEQTYQVDSTVDFPRMRGIFFEREPWQVSGQGHFDGSFHVFPGGYLLKGDFTSPVAGVNDLRFPSLQGSLEWQPGRFAVTRAESDFYGGRTTFVYGLTHEPAAPTWHAMFAADYDAVSLEALDRAAGLKDLHLVGLAHGHLGLDWTNGRFGATHHGDGETDVTAPANVAIASETIAPAEPMPPPGDPREPLGPLPVAGQLNYALDPDGILFGDSWLAHAATFVGFHGRLGSDGQANLPFHVTSHDWQASDRLLAAILTERGAPTSPFEVGGRGTFDGTMTQTFVDPRFEGEFSGDGMHVWHVTWGRAAGHIVVTKADVTVADGVIGDPAGTRIDTSGRFSLGYRRDGGEEIRATFHIERWPLEDFKAAFALSDWPIDGVGTADLDLHGPYRAPLGTGSLHVDHGVAWRETFDTADAAMTFESTGLNLSALRLAKGSGLVRGALLVNWNGTYSFDADGEHIAVESLSNFKVPKAPLSGQLQFHAYGAGRFDAPEYTFDGRVADLFAGDEGIGDVVGTLAIRDNVMTVTRLEAASKRLSVSGLGRIGLTSPYDSEFNLIVHDTSIDPYLKFFSVGAFQYGQIIVGGSAHVSGPLADPARLSAQATIDSAQVTLFDYPLTNDGPITLHADGDAVTVDRLQVTGADTRLTITGGVSGRASTVDLEAKGTANLGILQAFSGFGDMQIAGAAVIDARLAGPFGDVRLSGRATVEDGRLRFPSFARSLESINGPLVFEGDDLDVSGLRAKMGDGDVRFGGAVRFVHYQPAAFDLTAEGRSMHLRIPDGFSVTADASLSMTGPVSAPTLAGSVLLLTATMREPIQADAGLIGLAAAGVGGAAPTAAAPDTGESTYPLSFNIQVRTAGSLPFVNSKQATIYGSTNDLTIEGTAAKPILMGRLAIDRGQVFVNGNRIMVQPGSIDFSNPQKIDPVYNVQATTRAYLGEETYNISFRVTGTMDRLSPTFTSEPWLPTFQILSLLLGQSPNVLNAQAESLQSVQAERQLLPTAAAQLLTAPISAQVGSAVERTIPIDTAQFTPLLNLDPADPSLQQLNPSARVTLGKRISDRLFLTYSRDVNAPEINELILLEYEASDRVSWVLSRNEDHTFSLDFRIRYVF